MNRTILFRMINCKYEGLLFLWARLCLAQRSFRVLASKQRMYRSHVTYEGYTNKFYIKIYNSPSFLWGVHAGHQWALGSPHHLTTNRWSQWSLNNWSLWLCYLPMSLPTASLAEKLLNKLIRVKCEKCFNSWWNCLEMTQELKKNW